MIFVFTFVIYSIILVAQWQWQNPLPTGNPLNDVAFINENKGWIVGITGTFHYTENSGESWNQQLGFDEYSLYSIYFFDEYNGWVCGHKIDVGGAIFNSNDGGITWNKICNSVFFPTDIFFTDSNNGWFVNSWIGELYYTNDGGYNWNLQFSLNGRLNRVIFLNDSIGWVSGYDLDNSCGIILKTNDGGSTWDDFFIDTDVEFYDIFFIDENNGWGVGEDYYPGGRTIYHTIDGGENWINQCDSCWELNGVYFYDLLEGWAVGQSGMILHTENGGDNWEIQHSGEVTDYIESIHFTSNTNGWAVGHTNLPQLPILLHTTDGGINWHEYFEGITFDMLKDVHFFDENHGRCFSDFGDIYQTLDGGSNWDLQYSFTEEITINSSFFHDELNGWIKGYDMNTFSHVVIRTSDGGLSWTNTYLSNIYYVYDMFFTNTQNGWMVGENNSSKGIILYSNDGGMNWIEQYTTTYDASFESIFFIDDMHGWAVGTDPIIRYTTNGGNNWNNINTNVPFASFNDVYFVDLSNGWIVGKNFSPYGGLILYTPNGGQDWEIQLNDVEYEFNSVHFIDELNGWAVGSYGHIFSTFDGGNNWEIHSRITGKSPSDIFFTDINNGWIVGDYGTILHTNNGGQTGNTENKVDNLYLNVFPNPFKQNLKIEFNKGAGISTNITVYNSVGQIILNLHKNLKKVGKNQFNISTEHLSPGLYFVTLQTGKEKCTKKVLKL